MVDTPRQLKEQDDVLSSLNMAVDALNHAKEATSIRSVKAAFTSTNVLLTAIKDLAISRMEYVELGLACADVCGDLNRRMDKRRTDQLSQAVLRAVGKLTSVVDEIRRNVIKRGKRNAVSRWLHEKDDERAITTWRSELNSIHGTFNTELGANAHSTVPNIHTTISDVPRDISNADSTVPNVRPPISGARGAIKNTYTTASDTKSREDMGGQSQATHASAPSESRAPPRRDTYGTISNVRHGVSEVHHELVTTQTMVSDIRNILKSQQGASSQPQSTQNSAPGELPPPSPRVFFGRDELIGRIVHLAERLTPMALIGAGGIGKTSVILTVLHDTRVKQRFGKDRRFIRCDQFPASRTNLLRRLSEAVGAGVENPEDLTPLRPFLSSKEMLIVLDNAESILDLQGPSAQEIYMVVDELSQFNNICLCITSRISTIPPGCEILEIPTLSMEAALDTFNRIYRLSEQPDSVNRILEQLDFHPLSITLLATVAQRSKWDTNRLTREWDRQRTAVLHAQHSRSFATTIELSLASPMFRELGPDSRPLLEVIAFFPRGVNEEHTDWLFPTIPDISNLFDAFCVLSLTYRSNGYITMLAPLRDYLSPKDPASSPLLTATKECYFARLSANIGPDDSDFEEARWILLEDVNVEYLLNVFTLTDTSSETVWDACGNFMDRLYWYKPRLTMLGPKIEKLPDDHPSKPQCLRHLSWLYESVGNFVERKRLLAHALTLWRERGNEYWTAQTSRDLANTNLRMCHFEEGIQQAKEALEVFKRLGDVVKQAECLIDLAWLLCDDGQIDIAEESALRAIDLLAEDSRHSRVCLVHRALGDIYHAKGDTGKAIHHFNVALGVASALNWDAQLFWAHYGLVEVFLGERGFDDAQAHIEHARSYAVNDIYFLARVWWLQACCWKEQLRFEEAKSEALRALDVLEELGATNDMGFLRHLLQGIDDGIRQGGHPTNEADPLETTSPLPREC